MKTFKKVKEFKLISSFLGNMKGNMMLPTFNARSDAYRFFLQDVATPVAIFN